MEGGDRADTIVQCGSCKCAAATEMVDAVEKVMCLGLGGLSWAQQLFDIEALAYDVCQQQHDCSRSR